LIATALHLLIILPIFFTALVVHEVSHGWVANRLGDPTARHLGRLSFNPLRHIDPIGTILLPLLLLVTRAPIVFGWAKPVPIDVARLHSPKRDLVWVGLAGPAANFALAVVLAALLRLFHLPVESLVGALLVSAIMMNLVLGFFNLIPIPPLDGSRVAAGLLPYWVAHWLVVLEPFGFLVLIILMWGGLTHRVIWPLVMRTLYLLGVMG